MRLGTRADRNLPARNRCAFRTGPRQPGEVPDLAVILWRPAWNDQEGFEQ